MLAATGTHTPSATDVTAVSHSRHAVFVYGTLTDPAQVERVLDPTGDPGWSFAGSATVEGLHRVDGRYPTLVPGGRVDGRLLVVDEASLDRLDRYEGVDRGLYVRVGVPTTDGQPTEPAAAATGSSPDDDPGATDEDPVWAYVGDSTRLGLGANWPGDGSFRDRVRSHLDEADVRIEPSE